MHSFVYKSLPSMEDVSMYIVCTMLKESTRHQSTIIVKCLWCIWTYNFIACMDMVYTHPSRAIFFWFFFLFYFWRLQPKRTFYLNKLHSFGKITQQWIYTQTHTNTNMAKDGKTFSFDEKPLNEHTHGYAIICKLYVPFFTIYRKDSILQ